MNLFVLWSIRIILAQNPPDPPPEESWLAVLSLIANLVQGIIFLLGFTFSGLVLLGQWLAALFSVTLGFVWTGLQGLVTTLLLPLVATGVGIVLPLIVILVVLVILAA